MDPQPKSTIQPKARGYSVRSAIFQSHTVHEDQDLKILKLLEREHHAVSKHLSEVVQEILQDGASKEVEDYFKSTRRPATLDYEELGGLSDLGP